LTLPNGVLVEYGYDNASRLTSIPYKQNGTTVLGDLTYEYDKNGNRTKTGGSFARTGIPQATATTAYNAANHQTMFGDKTLAYDDNGNLQTIIDSSGTTTYTWNARNQLTRISGPGVSATFVYDGLGRREKKTINSNLTEFLYDGLNPVQETSGATVLANVLPGLGIDEFLTRTDVVAGVTSSFLTDALGSPVAVTDNAGAVQTEYTYEPFGRTTATGVSNSSSYQYTGRENDGTGLYYYRERFYHPELRRFMSEDPIGFQGQDVNLYSYVFNAPVTFTDPLGLRAIPTPVGPLPLPLPPQPINSRTIREATDFFRDLLDRFADIIDLDKWRKDRDKKEQDKENDKAKRPGRCYLDPNKSKGDTCVYYCPKYNFWVYDLRTSAQRGRPFGNADWITAMAKTTRAGLDNAGARSPETNIKRLPNPLIPL
jgi:RHS repeat-associated protein